MEDGSLGHIHGGFKEVTEGVALGGKKAHGVACVRSGGEGQELDASWRRCYICGIGQVARTCCPSEPVLEHAQGSSLLD